MLVQLRLTQQQKANSIKIDCYYCHAWINKFDNLTK